MLISRRASAGGMPPYQWSEMERHDYDYLLEKLRYAENFYDLFRIDHVVGAFRIWTIACTESPENAGLHGIYDPVSEKSWDQHGRQLLSRMVSSTTMLPCAEDLGTVPECTFNVLQEMAIPGMDVQRWQHEPGKLQDFKAPESYRQHSIAIVSTHDMSPLLCWWKDEVRGTEERKNFLSYIQAKKLLQKKEMTNFDRKELAELTQHVLKKVNQAASIFSIQLLQDWLSMDPRVIEKSTGDFRINFPGTSGDQNWSMVMPFSLEEMLDMKINHDIKSILQESGRI